MPLEKAPVGSPGFKRNIEEMVKSGHPQPQAIAAAYREARADADPHGVHAYHDACIRGDTAAQARHKVGR